jgi:hypothetical protein
MFRGVKALPTELKAIQGSLHPTRHHKPGEGPEPATEGRPKSPRPLTGRAKFYWDSYIKPCKWLGEFDGQRAYMWCLLSAEFESTYKKLNWRMIGQIRALGSELCLDPSSRARLGVKTKYVGRYKKKDKSSKYFAVEEQDAAA